MRPNKRADILERYLIFGTCIFLESKDSLTVPHTRLYFLDWKNDRGEL